MRHSPTGGRLVIDPETMDRTGKGVAEAADLVSHGKGWSSRTRRKGAAPARPAKDEPEAEVRETASAGEPADVDEEEEQDDAWENAEPEAQDLRDEPEVEIEPEPVVEFAHEAIDDPVRMYLREIG